ncbi:MAG: carbonic anhydrase [Oscillospiraceae bacterium]|nr:carbonic anhydrase [Oscillospiraceae bacterium]
MQQEIIERLNRGNRSYLEGGAPGDVSEGRRRLTAEQGQRPHTAVLCCSDSRVIPERIFSAGIGELFVIRVAGNVLGPQQLGSIAYAVDHLGCGLVLVLGHTGCGAVAAALEGGGHGAVATLTDEVLRAIGTERDPARAERRNVRYAVEQLRRHYADAAAPDIRGAIYDIRSGAVSWLDEGL